MAQNENYSQVDLRVGTEEQFNAKVGTLPAGTLFGTTDSTVSKADLSTDLKNEINGKINKPANPTSDSAVVINSSGEISTKPLTSITGKAEVAVSSTTPLNDEILWINPDGTSGGGSSGSGNVYMHSLEFDGESSTANPYYLYFYSTFNTSITYDNINEYSTQIPFGVLCHIDADGQFIFDGIITTIQQGSPGKIVLSQPGVGIQRMFKLNSDSVTEV